MVQPALAGMELPFAPRQVGLPATPPVREPAWLGRC